MPPTLMEQNSKFNGRISLFRFVFLIFNLKNHCCGGIHNEILYLRNSHAQPQSRFRISAFVFYKAQYSYREL